MTRTGLILATIILVGCGGASPSAPTPTATSTTSSTSAPDTAIASVQPTIISVSPNVVSTTGTWGTITGSEFQPGVTITIGGAVLSAVNRIDSNTIKFSQSSAHAPGSVDVVVTNPGGRTATLMRGYTYAGAESFDANGEWVAHADGRGEYLTDMRFTIKNNALVSVSCGTVVNDAGALTINNGQFSLSRADGLMIVGTLVSTITAYGQTNLTGCGDGKWWADKLPAAAAQNAP